MPYPKGSQPRAAGYIFFGGCVDPLTATFEKPLIKKNDLITS